MVYTAHLLSYRRRKLHFAPKQEHTRTEKKLQQMSTSNTNINNAVDHNATTTSKTVAISSQLQSIRQHVENHLAQHNYETAIFLADKLLTMTKNSSRTTKSQEVYECVFLLAKCFWNKGERRRACWLIRMQGNPNGLRERFLAAKCMEEVGDWNECLNILGVEDEEFSQFLIQTNMNAPDYQMVRLILLSHVHVVTCVVLRFVFHCFLVVTCICCQVTTEL